MDSDLSAGPGVTVDPPKLLFPLKRNGFAIDVMVPTTFDIDVTHLMPVYSHHSDPVSLQRSDW